MMPRTIHSLWTVAVVLSIIIHLSNGFISPHIKHSTRFDATSSDASSSSSNIIVLDHLNINHEQGTHDSLLKFYVDTLGMTLDCRKLENVEKKKGTVWVNGGATQFHLSEGKPDPQVVDGRIILAVESEDALRKIQKNLNTDSNILHCPYGNTLVLDVALPDPRGQQTGGEISSTINGIKAVELNVKTEDDLAGIARFYETTFQVTTSQTKDPTTLHVPFGPHQSLNFKVGPILNDDYLDGTGPHISLYVKDLEQVWGRASHLNYVNPRFKRQAHTLEEAKDQCMFRILHIVDPQTSRPIMRLEHEIRSPTKADGSPYKSYPFNNN